MSDGKKEFVSTAIQGMADGPTFDDIMYVNPEIGEKHRRWPDGTVIDCATQTITIPGEGWLTFEEWWEQKNAKD